MKGFLKLATVELKLFLREPAAMFFTLVFPILLLGVFGAIYGNEPSEFFHNHGYVDTICPAFIGLVIAMTGFTMIPSVFAAYREKGVLRRLRASPIRAHTVMAAWIFVYSIVTALGAGLMLLFGWLVFHLRFAGSVFYVVVFSALSMFSIFSVGFIIASLAPSVRTAETIGMVLYFPMIFLSGATIPIEVFPNALKQAVQFVPLTHVVKLMQGLWFGSPVGDHTLNIVVIAGIAVVGIIASSLSFRWE